MSEIAQMTYNSYASTFHPEMTDPNLCYVDRTSFMRSWTCWTSD